jgi:hypothetical protein
MLAAISIAVVMLFPHISEDLATAMSVFLFFGAVLLLDRLGWLRG